MPRVYILELLRAFCSRLLATSKATSHDLARYHIVIAAMVPASRGWAFGDLTQHFAIAAMVPAASYRAGWLDAAKR
jgi:hypothetical protein